jgi:hypothetical protein
MLFQLVDMETALAKNKISYFLVSPVCAILYLKVKFTLEQAQRPRGVVEVQLYSFFNLGARWRWVVKATPGRFIPGNDPVPII